MYGWVWYTRNRWGRWRWYWIQITIIKYFFIFYFFNFEPRKAALRLQKQVQAGMENQLNVKLVHENNLFKIFEASAARADFLLSHVGKDECFLIVKIGSAVIEIDGKARVLWKTNSIRIPAIRRTAFVWQTNSRPWSRFDQRQACRILQGYEW